MKGAWSQPMLYVPIILLLEVYNPLKPDYAKADYDPQPHE